MEINPKLILGSLILLLFFLVLTIFQARDNQVAAVLSSSQNKFRVSFKVTPQNQQQFLTALRKLDLPSSVKDGLEFELDATSSAKLNFASPIEAKIKIEPQTITAGGVAEAQLSLLSMEDFKLPQSTNLAVFAANFSQFPKARFKLPQEFSVWLDTNLAAPGQYLVIFGPDADFAIIFKSKSPDFEGLKNIRMEGEEPLYKKEEPENGIELHLLKLPQESKDQTPTFSFFQIDQWVFMTSSVNAAREFIKIQKSQDPSFNFSGSKEPVSAVIIFRNTKEAPVGENFYNILLPNTPQIAKTLDKISELKFTLKADRFSGLINIK